MHSCLWRNISKVGLGGCRLFFQVSNRVDVFVTLQHFTEDRFISFLYTIGFAERRSWKLHCSSLFKARNSWGWTVRDRYIYLCCVLWVPQPSIKLITIPRTPRLFANVESRAVCRQCYWLICFLAVDVFLLSILPLKAFTYFITGIYGHPTYSTCKKVEWLKDYKITRVKRSSY